MAQHNDEYNRGGMLAFLFSMGFSIAFIFYLVAIHSGVDLKENVIDPRAATQLEGGPQFDISKVSEPWVESEDLVKYGQKVYTTNCAMCHGPDGKGDGPAGAALNPKPRNFVEGKWTKGDGVINHFKVISSGISGTSMAGYSHFTTADRWALVHYIESITQNKSKDSAESVSEFAKSAK